MTFVSNESEFSPSDLDTTASSGEAETSPRWDRRGGHGWGVLGRWGRMALKECREILRDRRTLITLALMPLLLYPLLAVGFQQFLLGGVAKGDARPIELRIGVGPPERAGVVQNFLENVPPPRLGAGLPDASALLGRMVGGESGSESGGSASPSKLGQAVAPIFLAGGFEELDAALRSYQIDAWVRIDDAPEGGLSWEVVTLEGTRMGGLAVEFLEAWTTKANLAVLATALGRQRPPVTLTGRTVSSGEAGGAVSLAALVPLVLILMTITGAVYPAIDLTAGERERGTMEILIAAPTPRFLLLLSKYAAVVLVALLTATVNLVAMGLTLGLTGLGRALFGTGGLTGWAILQVFGLLLVFASFFSAVLMGLTSIARSFKEAQAYLIPLMLVSLAPGFAALMPGLALTPTLAAVPLLNVVLLARDALNNQADPALAGVVVVLTLIYAGIALALAARVFGAEAVPTSGGLESDEAALDGLTTQRDTVEAADHNDAADRSDDLPSDAESSRPARPAPLPSPSWVLVATAAAFPAYLFSSGLIPGWVGEDLTARLVAASVAQAVIFLAIPAVVLVATRSNPNASLALKPSQGRVWWLVALALGMSLWPFAHEAAVWVRGLGLGGVGEETLGLVQTRNTQLREAVAWPWLVLALALLPAATEELFFRGMMFTSLRRRFSEAATIGLTGLLFGLFHFVLPIGLLPERLIPSTMLGLVLGWLRAQSGSVGPGMLLHLTHNGLLVALFLLEPKLKAWGIGLEETIHLPWPILATAALVIALALTGAVFATRSNRSVPRGA